MLIRSHATLVSLGAALALASAAMPGSAAAAPGAGSTPAVPDRAVHGAEAAAALEGPWGGRIASRAGRSVEELIDLVSSDDSVRIAPDGELTWTERHLVSREGPSLRRTSSAPSTAEVLSLHSNPGADQVVFLDFDGARHADPEWTAQGVPDTLRGWDPSDDGAAFNAREREQIQQVWEVVADRFAPWEVDVTTADPGAEALSRTSESDSTYGTHLIYTSPGDPDIGAIYRLNGVAEGGMGSLGDPARAYVFGRSDWSVRDLADVGAHEVGHTLGLDHHQSTVHQDNYSGEMEDFGLPVNNWSPIMGAIGTPIVQWSRGDYNGSNHAQDDLAIIGSTLALRADEAPNAPAQAVRLPRGTAYISSESDTDSYALGTCDAEAQVKVSPVVAGSSLDLAAALVRVGEPNPVATANPPTYYDWWLKNNESVFAFQGTDAALTARARGSYVLQVRGGGTAPWAEGGYDAYGSVGGYVVTVKGCDGAVGSTAGLTVPGAPTALHAALGAEPLAVDWTAPWNDGGSAITGYQLYRQGYSLETRMTEGPRTPVGSPVPAPDLSTSFPAPPVGTYVYHLVAINARGESEPATSTPYSYGPAVSLLSAPTMQGSSNVVGKTVKVLAPRVSPQDAAIAYQWMRKGAGQSWQAIPGATQATYRLAAGDVGRQLSVTATASAAGHRPATSTSLSSAPVVRGPKPTVRSFGGPATGRFATAEKPDNNVGTGPNDVAVDAAGFVYVPAEGAALEGNDRIQKFTAGGMLVDTWRTPPSGRFRTTITSVDVGADGHVYVLDSSNRQVFTYDTDGTLLRRSSVPLVSMMLLLDQQAWLTADDDGNVYVSENQGGSGWIQKLDPRGELVATWKGLGDVQGLEAVTRSGRTTVYYADADNGRVKALDADTGASRGSWNGTTGGGAKFREPTDIAADGAGNLFVVEPYPSRVQKFGPTFKHLETYPVAGYGYGVAVGAGGQIYVAENQPDEEVNLVAQTSYAPSAPRNLRGSSGPKPGQVTLAWAAPATSASPITGYTVRVLRDGHQVAAVKTLRGNVTRTVVSGLPRKAYYNFKVTATNAAGDSPEVQYENWIRVE